MEGLVDFVDSKQWQSDHFYGHCDALFSICIMICTLSPTALIELLANRTVHSIEPDSVVAASGNSFTNAATAVGIGVNIPNTNPRAGTVNAASTTEVTARHVMEAIQGVDVSDGLRMVRYAATLTALCVIFVAGKTLGAQTYQHQPVQKVRTVQARKYENSLHGLKSERRRQREVHHARCSFIHTMTLLPSGAITSLFLLLLLLLVLFLSWHCVCA